MENLHYKDITGKISLSIKIYVVYLRDTILNTKPMKIIGLSLLFVHALPSYAQDQNYTAVNPLLFSYADSDIHLQPPNKYDGGKQIMSPDSFKYPWETRLDNGMPNALVDVHGNVAVYFSSFLVYSPTPPSKVGAMVFVNRTENYKTWERPDAGLYWYNQYGKTADEIISGTYHSEYQPTNIVAVDIESLGIYDDGVIGHQIQTIYKPQRDFHYQYVAAYPMNRAFTEDCILDDFSHMKQDRLQHQSVFTFRQISADTHMNWMFNNGKHFFTSRLNSRRSVLQPGEKPPFDKDPRPLYRRSLLATVGEQVETKNLDYNIVLDNSTTRWEPYSMQPFRMPGYDKDVWFGLVTMFGKLGYPETEKKQRTELAISDNGINWRYLLPGTPFIDNGTDPKADDFGCINVATPIYDSKMHGDNGNMPFFLYASANARHVEGRNSGLSLAMSKYGKIAGLKAAQEEKTFYSVTPLTFPGLKQTAMPLLSVKNAFALNAHFCPKILGDITDDPRQKTIQELDSYVQINYHSYNQNVEHGIGMYLGGALGSSVEHTHDVSDEFESVGIVDRSGYSKSKEYILGYIRLMSALQPKRIISFKDVYIPVVLETKIKNATLYSVKFPAAADGSVPIDFSGASSHVPRQLWTYTPSMSNNNGCYVESFKDKKRYPLILTPTCMTEGSIAVKIAPVKRSGKQSVLTMLNDESNFLSINMSDNGTIQYLIEKDGEEYVKLEATPPTGKDFYGKAVTITVEAVKNKYRKYHKDYKEEVTVMRVTCNDIGYEKIVTQPTIWNSRKAIPTKEDSCHARTMAYLPFSSIVGGMDRIIVGGSNEACADKFMGVIAKIEVSDKLPPGSNDFWTDYDTFAIEPTNEETEQ